MTKVAIFATIATCLALTACAPAEPETPAVVLPEAPAGNIIATSAQQLSRANLADDEIASLQATELGSINGCRIYRVIVDGKSFVLAAAYSEGQQTHGYAARACSLEPLS